MSIIMLIEVERRRRFGTCASLIYYERVFSLRLTAVTKPSRTPRPRSTAPGSTSRGCTRRLWMLSRSRCGRKCLDRSCWSTASLRRCDLLIDTKIASANTNMTSPTGDTAMIATAIVSFCSCTDKCSFHPLAGPRPIRSSSRMGMVPKILCRSNTFWFRQSRKHKRDGASRQQGSIQLKVVGC